MANKGGKVKLATPTGVETLDYSGKTADVKAAQSNLESRQKQKEEKFGGLGSLSELDISVEDFVAKKQTSLTEEQNKKKELESKASGATGTEKALLTNEIKRSQDRIDALNTEIESAQQSYSILSDTISAAEAEEKAAEEKLSAAQQAAIGALRNKAKDFDKLSPERQQQAVDELLTTGQVTDAGGKKRDFSKEKSAIDIAQEDVNRAKDKKETATQTKEKLYPGSTSPFNFTSSPGANQSYADKEFLKYKAAQSGTSETAVQRDLAQKLGKKRYENQQFYGGKVTEAKTALVSRRESAVKIGGSIQAAKDAMAMAKNTGDPAAQRAAAQQLADAQSRLTGETEGILNRKSTRLNSSHVSESRMPSSA